MFDRDSPGCKQRLLAFVKQDTRDAINTLEGVAGDGKEESSSEGGG